MRFYFSSRIEFKNSESRNCVQSVPLPALCRPIQGAESSSQLLLEVPLCSVRLAFLSLLNVWLAAGICTSRFICTSF
ncbi:hypothetical protein A4A49_17116 [Nicotiana attenuata]|uniref:Uncharacterized protein n=1 Tax=Nicotiana attenuata TaxID=49451 RepID=A0A1J6IMK9_NICAT|nr:hypothetical protein A4A49_17116 [Nicotiana attenuata]